MKETIKIIVEGDYACYARPEFKVERSSYHVPPPGALEGLVKNVYWKPAFSILVKRIVVFNPIRFINVRRNEVKEKVSFSNIKKQMNHNGRPVEMYTSEMRTQRAAMILKDVRYGIEFELNMTGLRSDHEDENEKKHYSIMKRRLSKGQCFRQPCLGCREFGVKSIQLVDDFDLSQVSSELKGDIDLGYMLYGMKFKDGGKPINNDWDNPVFSDEADAVFYRPHMIDGVIEVEKYREMMKC